MAQHRDQNGFGVPRAQARREADRKRIQGQRRTPQPMGGLEPKVIEPYPVFVADHSAHKGIQTPIQLSTDRTGITAEPGKLF